MSGGGSRGDGHAGSCCQLVGEEMVGELVTTTGSTKLGCRMLSWVEVVVGVLLLLLMLLLLMLLLVVESVKQGGMIIEWQLLLLQGERTLLLQLHRVGASRAMILLLLLVTTAAAQVWRDLRHLCWTDCIDIVNLPCSKDTVSC